jgi:hypothetical protein
LVILFLSKFKLPKRSYNANLFSMETPKKPLKNKSATAKPGAKKSLDSPEAIKPQSRFIDDDDDDEFDTPLDDLAAYESFEGLEEEEDF